MLKHYFFVRNMGTKIAGIERATIKRMELFEKMGEESIIATCTFNTALENILQHHGVNGEKSVNMYGYYQNLNKTSDPFTLESFRKKYPGWRLDKQKVANAYRIYDQDDRYVIYMECNDNGYVKYMNFFDGNKNKYKRLLFDEFGNPSAEFILGQSQVPLVKRYLNEKGETCIEEYFTMNDKNEIQVSFIQLHKNDRLYLFQSNEEFIAHWLDDLAQSEECIFYIDRNLYYAEAISKMKQVVPIYCVLHSVHTSGVGNVEQGNFKRHYKRALTNPAEYAGYIVSTNYQKEDLERRLDFEFPIYAIPVGYNLEREKISIDNRTSNKIVIPTRFSPEKRLDHVVQIIELVCKEVPDVNVHFFGFNTAPDNTLLKIKTLIAEKGLDQHFVFHNFTNNIFEELEDASAYLLTSNGEGFCLTLLEALSCGVPSFSYKIRYGPTDMIHSGENGYLIENGQIEQMAYALTSYLQNDEMKKRMSTRAYELAHLFDQSAIIEKWKAVIHDSKKL